MPCSLTPCSTTGVTPADPPAEMQGQIAPPPCPHHYSSRLPRHHNPLSSSPFSPILLRLRRRHLRPPFSSSSSKDSASVLQERLLLSDSDGEEEEEEGGRNSSGRRLLVVRRPVMEAPGDDAGGGGEDADRRNVSPLEVGLSEFARKMPIFEPAERVGGSAEKPLPINLELALYRAKVLARNFRYEEAEEILGKVSVFGFFIFQPCFGCSLLLDHQFYCTSLVRRSFLFAYF